MYLQQIRNATIFYIMVKKFLIDPVLAPKGSWPPFPNSICQDQTNPLVELPKDSPVFVQNTSDLMTLSKKGFKNLHSLDENTSFYGIHLIKTPGQHGRGDILLKSMFLFCPNYFMFTYNNEVAFHDLITFL